MASCKEWPGARDVLGYGRFNDEYAHRLVFQEAHGYLPDVVRHSCDNPGCVEIMHLVEGTQQDNIQDMWDRHRARPRGRIPMTLPEVVAIAARLESGETQMSIANDVGLSQKHVWRIAHGWRPKGGDSNPAA
jgi:hypothetical protein